MLKFNSEWPIKFSVITMGSILNFIKDKRLADNELVIGRGKHTNITMIFKQPQEYFGGLGLLTEKITCLHLSVKDPDKLIKAIENQGYAQAA
jgi:hypothetical protein